MAQSEITQLLTSLKTAIKSDRRFFVAAQTDPTLESVRTQVDHLLMELTQEAETKAEKDIASAQSALSEMEGWHVQKLASSQFQDAKTDLINAKKAFKTKSYFGYLDSIPAARQAKRNAEAATTVMKTSMRKNVTELANQANSLQAKVMSLIKGQYSQRRQVEVEFRQTLTLLKQAQNYTKVDTYDGYRESQESLWQCVNVLKNLHAELAGQKHLQEGRHKRNVNLFRLHLAFLLILAPAVPGILFLVAAANGNIDNAAPFMGYAVASIILVVIGDRIWSIGESKPGNKFQWGLLWLALLNGGIGIILPIIALFTYVGGLTEIISVYRDEVGRAKSRTLTGGEA